MKKLFLTFITVLFLTSIANATVYYTATSGNDSNPGTSGSPFLTVQKCATVAVAGDTCTVVGPGTFREQVTPAASGTNGNPIIYTGTNGAIIAGSNLATSWSSVSGNIYKSNIGTITAPTQVYVDGVFIDVAHYPSSGWLFNTSTSTITHIIDSAIASGGGTPLTSAQVAGSGSGGATVCDRVFNWVVDCTTTASSFNTATGDITLSGSPYGGSSSMTAATGWGFYLNATAGSGLTWMQTYAGEYYYDGSTYIDVWDTQSDSPSGHTVEIPNRQYVFNISNKSYITIQNLELDYANANAINLSNANNITVSSDTFTGSLIGVFGATDSNVMIQNSTFTNQVQSGMSLNTQTNLTVSGNTVNNAGNIGVVKTNQGAGINLYGASNTNFNATNNTVSNSGYAGISYFTQSGTVSGNTINESCLALDDCGGIYTYDGHGLPWVSTITGNTVLNTICNITGTPSASTFCPGIYLDDLANGYTVTTNYVNNSDIGIFDHTGFNNTITGNIVYKSRNLGFSIANNTSGESAGAVYNNIVTGNIFESTGATATDQFYSIYDSNMVTAVKGWGTFSNNTYCNPNQTNAIWTENSSFTNTYYTLGNWQSTSSLETGSTFTNALCESGGDTLQNAVIVNGVIK